MSNKRVDPSTVEVGDYIAVMSPVTDDGTYTWTFGSVTGTIANPSKPNLFSFTLSAGSYIYDMEFDKTVSKHYVEDHESPPRFNSLTTPFIMVFKTD